MLLFVRLNRVILDMLENVSKTEIINMLSDRARSLARELDRAFGVVSVEINGKRWIKK